MPPWLVFRGIVRPPNLRVRFSDRNGGIMNFVAVGVRFTMCALGRRHKLHPSPPFPSGVRAMQLGRLALKLSRSLSV
jgi:hypothetical protein